MTKSNYLFHFIISDRINSYVDYLKKNLNFRKNCELFDYILEIISNNLQNLKGIIGDHFSEYEFIDNEDPTRIDKYVRLNVDKYKLLKKWHFLFNEYGMSVILRDIIIIFYEGIVKHGVERFIKTFSKKLNILKIKNDLKFLLTQLLRTSIKKRILFSLIIQNLPNYA